jgi:hypothetical protein
VAFQTLSGISLPSQDRIARAKRPQYEDRPDPQEGLISDPWNDVFTRLIFVAGQSPNRLNSVRLTDREASIAATDMSGGSLSAGLYELKYYVQVVRAGGVSSSIAVSFSWLNEGTVQNHAGPADTGNALDTWVGESIMVQIDGNSPVTYATTYASVGAPTMLYDIDVVLVLVKG